MTPFLVDTNILIYYLAGAFTPDQKRVIDPVLEGSFTISIITRIELLGWEGHTRTALSRPEVSLTAPGVFLLPSPLRKRPSSCGH